MSTTVTVTPPPEANIPLTAFADLTPVALISITPAGGASFILTFDGDLTPDVLAAVKARAEAKNANEETIRNRAYAALVNNRTYLATAPNDQVAALTRQMNGVIRVILGQLDGTN